MAKPGRKRILDGYKRREILAILAVGGSRQLAADYVGCCVNTIHNTAERDPPFSEKLRQKERQAEIGYLESIRTAARNQRHWRAAAWALERLDPERYAKRNPEVITVRQVRQLLAQLAEVIVEEVPVAQFRKNMIKRLDAISEQLKDVSQK